MKNKSNQIIILYSITAILVAVLSHYFFRTVFSNNNAFLLSLCLSIGFIVISTIIFITILKNVIQKNKTVFENLVKSYAEIEESNNKYNIVAKATSDTIRDWDIENDLINWSNSLFTNFGYKDDEIGKTSAWWFDNIHPEDSIKMSIRLYSFIEEKSEKWQDQYRFKCADGSYKYVFDRGFILKDENDQVVRMIGAIQDITKQKEEEQRLKLLETVITQTKDSIIIIAADAQDAEIPKIIYSNPAFSLMSGYSPRELAGQSFSIFTGPKSDKNEYEKLLHSFKNQKELQTETISYKKNQEEYWVSISMVPVFNAEQELSHWISIQRDITQNKKQEVEKEQLIRELTQNNKDLKQFSYITSHNLRAPLSNLTGLLNLIEDTPIEDPELKEIFNGFSKSTHLLNDTIEDLAKVIIIKDNPSIVKEKISLLQTFEKVFSQLNYLIDLHQPIILIDFKKAEFIYTNKAYLESIMLNLVSNSIKYRSDIHPLKIEITSDLKKDELTIKFKDNGIGIDLKRHRDNIFGLYQRFHDYPDSKGLGLYLVKSQIESLNGTISVESEVNIGTVFELTFNNQ